MKINHAMPYLTGLFSGFTFHRTEKKHKSRVNIAAGFVAIVIVFTGSLPLFSQSTENLEAYLTIAAENNPQLQAAFRQYEASLQRVNQAGTLQDPQLNMGMFLRPMELLMGNQRGEVSVMQMFPWFGTLKVQKEEAAYMAQAKYAQFRELRNNLLYEVKETYYALMLLEKEREILEQNIEILESLERILLVKYQGGNQDQPTSSGRNQSSAERKTSGGGSSDGMGMGGNTTGTQPTAGRAASGMTTMQGGTSGIGLTEIYRVQVQMRTLKTSIAQIADDKLPLLVKMNTLLHQPPETPIIIDNIPLPRTLTDEFVWAMDSAIRYNPMVQMYEAEQLAFQKQEEMASKEGKPMIGLGLNYMLFSARPEQGAVGGMSGMDYMPAGMGNNMVMPMLNMSLPIYRKKYKSMQAEAVLYGQGATLSKQAVENQLLAQLASIRRDLASADRSLELLAYQKEMTQKMLDLTITAYTTEGAAYEDLLLIQQELLDYQLSEAEALVSKNLAYAALEKIIGY